MIVVIAILLGILLAVGAVTGSRESEARVRMQTLMAIADEYEAQTKGMVVNHQGTLPIDWSAARPFTNYHMNGSGHPDDSSERFVSAVMNIAESREQILNLERTKILVDLDGDGFFELRDAWGNMLIYMAANDHKSLRAGGYAPPLERGLTKMMLPEHPVRFFASAGEDGQFNTPDDLYSFAIE